jgi:hypothetical protein
MLLTVLRAAEAPHEWNQGFKQSLLGPAAPGSIGE